MDTRTGEIHNMTPEMWDELPEESKKYMIPITPTKKQKITMKVGRNEPCPCGSGLKFKKCHPGKQV
jgi:uncharacterized protein YecA (UPF0149 family)